MHVIAAKAIAFSEALNRLEPGKNKALSLANAFLGLNELDLALEVYVKAQGLGTRDLEYQLVDLQGRRGDYPGMIDAAVALLHLKPTYLRNIQNSFSRNLRIQDNPEAWASCSVPSSLVQRVHFRRIPIFAGIARVVFQPEQGFCQRLHSCQVLGFALQRVRRAARGTRPNGGQKRRCMQTAAACYQFVASKGPDNPYFYHGPLPIAARAHGPFAQRPRPRRWTPLRNWQMRYRIHVARSRHPNGNRNTAKNWPM